MTDEELALAVQAGTPDMFAPLVERYQEKLLRYGRKFLNSPEDIEDIVQDVFVSAYQNMQSFDASQKFSPWVYRIAHNAFVNGLKKKSRNPLVYVDFDTFLSHPVYDDPVPHERELDELKVMLEKSLDTLDYKYREVLVLYYLEEISYKDIADILQVPQGTVGVRLKRAREALGKAYEDLNKKYG
ncbi:MAG TPA: RNA polymerase sigma factor [Candidatus Paceibacterota bacterium]|jgi:RNA polymerase sigma-70 factor (ECF subfamily)|nr:RNA polymerase sigma factor [Candidatus Paceibacterota bacterium]